MATKTLTKEELDVAVLRCLRQDNQCHTTSETMEFLRREDIEADHEEIKWSFRRLVRRKLIDPIYDFGRRQYEQPSLCQVRPEGVAWLRLRT